MERNESAQGKLDHLQMSYCDINSRESYMREKLTIVVVGASGDLAKKKTYPALFDLFINGFLPESVKIVGYARSALSNEAFQNTISPYLKSTNLDDVDRFLSKCFYFSGQYDLPKDYQAFSEYLSNLADILVLFSVCIFSISLTAIIAHFLPRILADIIEF